MKRIPILGLCLGAAVLVAPPALALVPEPHWYSDGVKIAEGNKVSVETKGSLTLHYVKVNIACKVDDTDVIENPTFGFAGFGEIKSFTTDCKSVKSAPCNKGEKIEVLAFNLPWVSVLSAGPPIRDEIKGIELRIICETGGIKKLKAQLTGTLMPEIGASVAEFGEGSG